MMQNRFFFNPELDTKFTSFLPHGWLDDLSGRLALWGFYDGLYATGPEQYRATAADITFHNGPNGAFQTKGYSRDRRSPATRCSANVRDIYGERWRVNEAYMNISQGPLVRAHRTAAISWGEADTIGLLDANNPFDTTIVTRCLPGPRRDAHPAVDVARHLPAVSTDLGPFSSGLLDTYIVPGMIDTQTSPLQMQSRRAPYSAPAARRRGRVSRSSSAVRR